MKINMHPTNEKSNFGLTLPGRIIHGTLCCAPFRHRPATYNSKN
jgi:hypothetical protein